MKVRGGGEKSLLRLAAANLMPAEVLSRPKSGYPAMHDPTHEAEVRRAVRRLVDDHSSPLFGLLDGERLRRLTDGFGSPPQTVRPTDTLLPRFETRLRVS